MLSIVSLLLHFLLSSLALPRPTNLPHSSLPHSSSFTRFLSPSSTDFFSPSFIPCSAHTPNLSHYSLPHSFSFIRFCSLSSTGFFPPSFTTYLPPLIPIIPSLTSSLPYLPPLISLLIPSPSSFIFILYPHSYYLTSSQCYNYYNILINYFIITLVFFPLSGETCGGPWAYLRSPLVRHSRLLRTCNTPLTVKRTSLATSPAAAVIFR